jgi:protease-4
MDTPQEKTPDTAWERKTLEKLLFAAYEEQKSRRRWSIFSARPSCCSCS